MDLLRDHIEKHLPVSNEEWTLLESLLEEKIIEKNELLLSQNQVENYVYFVLDGIFRFYLELPEKDITFDFAFADEFMSSYTSFLTGNKSQCSVQALTKSKLVCLSKENLNQIFKQTTWGESLSRIIAEELFIQKSEREGDFMLLSAEERYYKLFYAQPKLIQEIPQKYLASYIGITPQALSRIRKRAVS